MGTLRREVARMWAGLCKLLNTPLERLWKRGRHVYEVRRQVGERPVVQGFTPYFYAPSMQDRIEHAERAIERWFQGFTADILLRSGKQHRRPAFFQRVGTELHYIHRGHPHGAKRRLMNRAQRRAAS